MYESLETVIVMQLFKFNMVIKSGRRTNQQQGNLFSAHKKNVINYHSKNVVVDLNGIGSGFYLLQLTAKRVKQVVNDL